MGQNEKSYLKYLRWTVLLSIVTLVALLITYRDDILPLFFEALALVSYPYINGLVGRGNSWTAKWPFHPQYYLHSGRSMLHARRLDDHSERVPLSLGLQVNSK